MGRPELAVERATHAMRLSPQDPQLFAMQAIVGLGHFMAKRYAEAYTWANAGLRDFSNFIFAACVAAAAAALNDQPTEAEHALARVREIEPDLRISNILDRMPFQHTENRAHMAEGLRRAGLSPWPAAARGLHRGT